MDYVPLSNLANLDAAMRGGLLEVIEVHLMCVGAGNTGLCGRGGIPRRVRDHDR